jgi:hypothetical protein
MGSRISYCACKLHKILDVGRRIMLRSRPDSSLPTWTQKLVQPNGRFENHNRCLPAEPVAYAFLSRCLSYDSHFPALHKRDFRAQDVTVCSICRLKQAAWLQRDAELAEYSATLAYNVPLARVTSHSTWYSVVTKATMYITLMLPPHETKRLAKCLGVKLGLLN